MLDVLLENAAYPDFKRKEMTKANIGIKDGKIDYIGTGNPEAEKNIDVTDRVVSPGFIDIHMHEENFAKEGAEYVISQMMLEMGVTTAVGGNCGLQNQDLSYFKSVINSLKGSPVNYLMLAGYNQFRYELGVGRYEAATETQREKIRKMIKRELNEGAIGISFGIEYDPGIIHDEMIFAANAIEGDNYLVAAHYRSDCIKNIDSIKEMINFAQEIPMKFQISHLSSCSAMGWMSESLAAINEAMEKNHRLNYDTYPYNAFSTSMGSAVFDDGCLEAWGKDYDSILLTGEPYKNVFCSKEIFEDARKNYPGMLAVAFVMNEHEIAEAIKNKNGMIASDAIINNGNGHPRAAGTFPRVLGKYVRQEKQLTMVDALRKMTLEPAERLNLKAKGRIEIGCDGDLTIFNPETIIDGATFENIKVQPEGIDYVFVDGKLALDHKVTVNGRLGKFIRA